MSNVEVVVATVNSDWKQLVKRMNIKTDCCIANQCGDNSIIKEHFNNNLITVISTDTRGVGLNRNLGLCMSSRDILLLADDDIVYKDDYKEKIEKEFEHLPNADVIIFRMEFMHNGEIYDVDKHKTKRVGMLGGLSFGAYQIAIRKQSLLKSHIFFSELFGGGCKFSSGEDSLFLIDCFRKKMKVYTSEVLIGTNVRDKSSWFTGFNEKFYFDRGVFAKCAFPKLSFFVCLYYALVYRKHKELSFFKKINLMLKGRKCFSNYGKRVLKK